MNRHDPGRDLEWLLGPMLVASGVLVGWLLFHALAYLPW